MNTPLKFLEEVKQVLEESKKFLEDLRYYDVSSSNYMQILVTQKIHQLEGIAIRLEEYEKDPKDTELNLPNLYHLFRDIKTEVTLASKKWKRQVEIKYSDLKCRIGKLYFVSAL